MSAKKFIAVDLGASSGRVIVGILENGRISLEEMHRFENGPVERDGSLFWDIDSIFSEVKAGIKKAFSAHPDARSIGIDTWGVDYVVLKPDGTFARAPYNYRDARTEKMPEQVFAKVPETELYARTGIQRMLFNTIYQLAAHQHAHPEDFAAGNRMLLIPDALAYLLCGSTTCEYTEASTTNLLNAARREWDWETIEKLGMPRSFFPELAMPSSTAGKLSPELAAEFGCSQVQICKVGSHDTASAVASVPAPAGKKGIYISFGTWALFGAELDKPVLTQESLQAGFTNEGGLNGKILFLTNIIGMWLAQELRADWAKRDGEKMPWSRIDKMAAESKPLQFIINPNAHEFLAPGDMAGKIRRFCERTGQGTPDDAAAIRCIYDSLGLCFRAKMEQMSRLSGTAYDCLNIVGGGSNAKIIMQIATDICNVRVIAGPVEATAAGNILSQAMACGEISGLEAARDIVRASFTPDIYDVKDTDRHKYDTAYERFCKLTAEQ